jgi:hypothetical protein
MMFLVGIVIIIAGLPALLWAACAGLAAGLISFGVAGVGIFLAATHLMHGPIGGLFFGVGVWALSLIAPMLVLPPPEKR